MYVNLTMETDKEIIKQLKRIAESLHCDIIEITNFLDGRPMYRLRNSAIPKGAKTGRPILFSFTADHVLFELDSVQVHEMIVSYKGLCKRVQ